MYEVCVHPTFSADLFLTFSITLCVLNEICQNMKLNDANLHENGMGLRLPNM